MVSTPDACSSCAALDFGDAADCEQLSVLLRSSVQGPTFDVALHSIVAWSVRSPSALPRLPSALHTRRLPVRSPSTPQALDSYACASKCCRHSSGTRLPTPLVPTIAGLEEYACARRKRQLVFCQVPRRSDISVCPALRARTRLTNLADHSHQVFVPAIDSAFATRLRASARGRQSDPQPRHASRGWH